LDWAVHLRRILSRLGEDATFTPAGGEAATVKGIYTEAHRAMSFGPIEVSSSYPTFGVMTEDVPGVARGDALTVSGTAYTVRDVQADEPGGVTVLELEVA
jgi:hypothetical protein